MSRLFSLQQKRTMLIRLFGNRFRDYCTLQYRTICTADQVRISGHAMAHCWSRVINHDPPWLATMKVSKFSEVATGRKLYSTRTTQLTELWTNQTVRTPQYRRQSRDTVIHQRRIPSPSPKTYVAKSSSCYLGYPSVRFRRGIPQ